MRVFGQLHACLLHDPVPVAARVCRDDADVRRHHVTVEREGQIDDALRAQDLFGVLLGQTEAVAAEVAAQGGNGKAVIG